MLYVAVRATLVVHLLVAVTLTVRLLTPVAAVLGMFIRMVSVPCPPAMVALVPGDTLHV